MLNVEGVHQPPSQNCCHGRLRMLPFSNAHPRDFTKTWTSVIPGDVFLLANVHENLPRAKCHTPKCHTPPGPRKEIFFAPKIKHRNPRWQPAGFPLSLRIDLGDLLSPVGFPDLWLRMPWSCCSRNPAEFRLHGFRCFHYELVLRTFFGGWVHGKKGG